MLFRSKAGGYFYSIARGIDNRPVRADRVRKSVGAENTFAEDLTAFDAMREGLGPIVDKVWRFCDGSGVRGRTVTLKMKYADFELITRSHTNSEPVATRGDLERISLDLLARLCPTPKGVRLLGVSLSALDADRLDADPQMDLAL